MIETRNLTTPRLSHVSPQFRPLNTTDAELNKQMVWAYE